MAKDKLVGRINPEARAVGKNFLTDEERMEVIRRIAWFWKPAKIHQFLQQEYGKDITSCNFLALAKSERWKPILKGFRDEYVKSLAEVPLANKRKRLDELQDLYESALDAGNTKEARELIREFREEMERKVGEVSFNFTQVTHNEFHDMSDEDLMNEKAKTIEQLEKVRKMKLLSDQRGETQ